MKIVLGKIILILLIVFNVTVAISKESDLLKTGINGIDNREYLNERNDPDLKREAAKVIVFEACGGFSTAILTRSKKHKEDLLIINAHNVFDGKGNYKIFNKTTNKNKIKKTACTLDELKQNNLIATFFLDERSKKFELEIHESIISQPVSDINSAKNWMYTGEDSLIFTLNKMLSLDINPYDHSHRRGFSKFLKTGSYDDIAKFNMQSETIGFHNDKEIKPVVMNNKYEVILSASRVFNISNGDVYNGDYLRTKADYKKMASGSPHYIRQGGEYLAYARNQLELALKDSNNETNYSNYIIKTEKLVNKYDLFTN